MKTTTIYSIDFRASSSFLMMRVYILAEDFNVSINDRLLIRVSTSSLAVSVVYCIQQKKDELKTSLIEIAQPLFFKYFIVH